MTKSINDIPEIGWLVSLTTYTIWALMIFIGHLRDFLGKITGITRFKEVVPKKGYAAILKSWESFYTRRAYYKFRDCWSRPISSAPGKYIDVIERTTKDGNFSFQTTGRINKCLNLGSYNYLGFADDWQQSCGNAVFETLHKFPISLCTSKANLGMIQLHHELEMKLCQYLRKEAVMIYSMGYDTNSSTIPLIAGPGCLIISDELNHTSIVNGVRASGAQVRTFHHNNTKHLEDILRESIIQGQPRHHRPWKKIVVMVEGIYSMEGDMCRLPEIVALKKKYKVYLYLDEAHSIGAIGATGRGICEYCNVNPNDIDILMGTFTKSFGAMGGYIAGSKELINYLRASSAGSLYHNNMSPVVCQQVISALRIILGEDGTTLGRKKLDQLRDNCMYFRQQMVKMGVHVYGDEGSPIIPMMIYIPTKIGAFSRECLKRGLAVVVVGFPATSVVLSRSRFCISAAHTREELDEALKIIDEDINLAEVGRCIRYKLARRRRLEG